MKWYTETIYTDMDTGESVPTYKFKTDYYEIKRETTRQADLIKNTGVTTITVIGRKSGQGKLWEEPPRGTTHTERRSRWNALYNGDDQQ